MDGRPDRSAGQRRLARSVDLRQRTLDPQVQGSNPWGALRGRTALIRGERVARYQLTLATSTGSARPLRWSDLGSETAACSQQPSSTARLARISPLPAAPATRA